MHRSPAPPRHICYLGVSPCCLTDFHCPYSGEAKAGNCRLLHTLLPSWLEDVLPVTVTCSFQEKRENFLIRKGIMKEELDVSIGQKFITSSEPQASSQLSAFLSPFLHKMKTLKELGFMEMA